MRAEGAPLAAFTHTWTSNRPGAAYRVVFELGGGGLLAPALVYRRWLLGRGELRTLKAKIAANPRVERLLGAAHAYVLRPDSQ